MTFRRFTAACLAVLAVAAATYAQDNTLIRAYQTTTAPFIDGVIAPGEWDAAGPPIVITPDSPGVGIGSGIADDPYGGADDLSFQFRVMWEEPWMAYFLVEVFDDIAMDSDPRNLWERDQVELFIDGDDLEGSDVLERFQWWDNEEIYGKFGVSREGTFEGNPAIMTDDQDGIFADDETFFVAGAAVATETGVNANYFVEYAISLEPMFLYGTFDGTETATQQKIVADSTAIKYQIAISDDDNFDDGNTERSHTVAMLGLSDWRATDEFADLLFVGPYSAGEPGDFDGDGMLGASDINALTAAIGTGDTAYDLTGDGVVDRQDHTFWVKDLKNTWIGDANLDGEFSSTDFVTVFQAQKFETGNPAGWGEGDWNADGVFSSSDFVVAFQDSGFEMGPRAAVSAVPEPSAIVLLVLGACALVGSRRR